MVKINHLLQYEVTSVFFIFQSDFEYFLSEFTSLLKKSLIYGDKQPAVERTLNFVAKFATSKKSETEENGKEEKAKDGDEEEGEEEPEEADPFLVKLIQFLLNVRTV